MKTISKSTFQARSLRHNQTFVERQLWQQLRAKQLGVKFRRQQPIGDYIVDFVCYEKKIIIEIDGGQHSEERALLYDAQRTKYLEELGYIVLRFWNNEVIEQFGEVLQRVHDAVSIE